MPTKAKGFQCPKCKEKTMARVQTDPLNLETGGSCHQRGKNCRHIVVLQCEQCRTEHAVESAWHRRW